MSEASMPDKPRVMVFGVFDRLHDGHWFMLREAAALGEVIAVVARDKAVERLKGRVCRENEHVRMENIRKENLVSKVILGDAEEGTYGVVNSEKPDVIALGYDQDILEADLRQKMEEGIIPVVGLVRLPPFKPEELHSSLLD